MSRVRRVFVRLLFNVESLSKDEKDNNDDRIETAAKYIEWVVEFVYCTADAML